MSTSELPPSYLLVSEVATRIHRSERTAWERIARAGVPRYRDVSGRTVIREDHLQMLDAPVLIEAPDAA